MSLPVNTTEFWKERIAKSKEYGDIHHSVYISRNSLWSDIWDAHKKILQKEIDPMWDVLDAGCGYGRTANLFNPSRYTGIDLSPDFIELAQKSFPGYTFQVEDMQNLPFPDKRFDVAFCISIKQMIIGNLGEEAWAKMESELKRVADKVLILEYENPDQYTILGR